MATCRYALKSNPLKSVDAKYLGYWSMKWASEQATTALQAFQRPPLAEFPIMRAAVAQPFSASLILIALHGAVYWAAAAGIPFLSGRIDQPTYADTLDEFRLGRDDCLGELCIPSGDTLPKTVAVQVANLVERFYQDVLHDLSHPTPTEDAAAATWISRTTASVVNTFGVNFRTDFPVEQQRVFGGFVDEAVQKLIIHAQEAMDIRA